MLSVRSTRQRAVKHFTIPLLAPILSPRSLPFIEYAPDRAQARAAQRHRAAAMECQPTDGSGDAANIEVDSGEVDASRRIITL